MEEKRVSGELLPGEDDKPCPEWIPNDENSSSGDCIDCAHDPWNCEYRRETSMLDEDDEY